MVQREGAKCPLCKKTSQKRFPSARGLRQHLRSKHAAANLSDPTIDAFIAQVTFPSSKSLLSGRDAEAQTKPKPTAAWISAAQRGDISSLLLLQKKGCWRWNMKDKLGAIAEHYAAGSGHLECLKWCLAQRKAECSVHGDMAVSPGSPCICPANIKKCKRNDGRFSIHWAARNNHKEVLEWLVKEQVVDIDAPTYDGTTPLHLAVLGCHAALIRLMVDKLEADPRRKNRWGCDLSHWLGLTTCTDKSKMRTTCVEIFENLGFDVAAVNQEGHSLLHKAAVKGNEVLLDWCREHASILGKERLGQAAKPDLQGNTPMDLARRGGHEGYAKKLDDYLLSADNAKGQESSHKRRKLRK